MAASLPHFHVWVPGLAETGGIQHYSACFIRALQELFPGAIIDVLAKNDVGTSLLLPGVRTTRCFGRLPGHLRTAAFAASGIASALRERPTVMISTHPHFSKAQAIARTLSGVPYLACAHGIETWGHLHGSLLWAIKGAAGLLPVSEFTRQVLIREGGLAADKIQVVPDTFREDHFRPGPKPASLLQRHGLQPDQPVLLTVGRLAATEAYKGQDKVIAALKIIRQSIPETRYLIVGAGDDKARLQRCAEEHGQQEAVIFAGFVPDEELPDYYRLCDAFVMPSTGEGFGIVYLEALASGRPCVVGNADASPEAIANGRLGFVVDPHSVPAIAGAVLNLLTRNHDKPWLYQPEALRQEVIDLYGFEAFKRSLHQALTRLVPQLASTAG